ncbi:MAG: thermonuclease family protein, partial [Dehalococcoidia bacterium]
MKNKKLKRVLLVTFTTVLIISLAFFLSEKSPGSEEPRAYLVIKVIDGDTIKIRMQKVTVTVRLLGVDTPETVHPGKPVEHYGKEASTFTRNLLKGETVRLEYEDGASSPTSGRYGRILAYVYRQPDGFFLNEELVRQGYA